MSYGNYAPFYRGGFFNPMQTPQMPQMAENQGQFAPQFQQPMQTNPAPMHMQPTQMSVTNDMIWVLNRNEADSYPVAPNNSGVLWDKSNPTIYVKSVNASGMPSMRVLDFTERSDNSQNNGENALKEHKCTCGDNFVTKEEFNALKGKFYDLQARYDAITMQEQEQPAEKPKTTTKKTKESEE